jgi:DNA-binding transcriptional LysR family regulator
MMSTAPHNPHIMGLLSRFARRYPGVEIDLMTMSSLAQRTALIDDTLDLGFHWAWGTRAERTMVTHLFPPHRFMLVLSPEHPLAQKKRIAPIDLQDMTWFVTGAQHNRTWQQFTLNLFQSLRFTPARLIEKNPVPMIMASVAAGQGVSLVPDFMATAFPEVRYVPLPKIPGLASEINLCLTKKKLHQDGLIADFYAMAAA